MVKLTECICDKFYNLFWDIMYSKHSKYDLIGGRGSTKSSVVSLIIVLGIMQDPEANGIVYRKVADTIDGSIYEQIVWAIDKLGVNSLWHCTRSPYKCIYTPTGQQIRFKGLDKAKKSKSIKVARGYFKYLWFEEFDEFAGEEEIRSVEQSVIRAGDDTIVFRTMNPPRNRLHWANMFIEKEKLRNDVFVSQSTYLDVPPEWLGKQFLAEADFLKKTNEKSYQHEYLGIPVGTGTTVFDNLRIEPIEAPDQMGTTYFGVDWGYYPDPFQWVKMAYNPATTTLYIYDELRLYKTSNRDSWDMLVEKKGVTTNDFMSADSAEPKSIGDFRSYGANIKGAKKFNGSVRYSMKWLQSLREIVIDPVTAPNCAREFQRYEYELTADGLPLSEFPDKDNHTIDAVRYAMQTVWRRKGQ